MKIVTIINGGVNVVLSPENELEKQFLLLLAGATVEVKPSYSLGEGIEKDCLVISSNQKQKSC